MATREWNLWYSGPLFDDAPCSSQMAPPMQFECKECTMQFSGPMPYMDHLKSARHQKKVAAQKHLEILTGGGTTVSSSLGSGTAVGYTVTASPSLHIDSLPFVCKLCNIAMNCQDALTAHNQGKKHQRTLQTEEVLRQLAATRDAVQPLPMAMVAPQTPTVSQSPQRAPTSPVSQPAQEQPVKQTEETGEVIDLSCRFRGIVPFENVLYKLEHLDTEAHLKKKMKVLGEQTIATSVGITPHSDCQPVEENSSSKS
ncbi:hypothetical protein HPB50_019426 [Hyalomma asiaticum]|uniref:Uncharacterized protein n=1 Tax=Hyalomma asiaticum TaxID=266040 RepID=A0ACB7RNK5_HYAAI|nr:hypothetical protein HPB50_019426 [Hyalomma asiaticum]